MSMNAKVLQAAGVDHPSGVRRFMGRVQLYEKVLAKFPGDDTFARIRADYERGDNEALLRDTHEFKGMCANMAIVRAAEAAGALVDLLRGPTPTPAATAAAYALLEGDYLRAVQGIGMAEEAGA